MIEYPQLVGVLASHQFTERPELHGWGEVHDHAEAMPDDDDLFWLYSAEDLGILSEGQVEEIFDAIQAASQRARPGTAPRRLR